MLILILEVISTLIGDFFVLSSQNELNNSITRVWCVKNFQTSDVSNNVFETLFKTESC
jgi:hypothetical protein